MKEMRHLLDVRISILYLLFGGMWILISDTLTAWLVSDPETLTRIQIYKGWVFIAASALLIFQLLRRELRLHNITEGQLAESEERYRQLFEHSMDAILLTSPNGSIHAANPAACAMFGRTESEIKQIGRNGLVDVNDPRLKPALEERARTGRFHGELIFLRAGGIKFEGEITSNLFKTREGADRTSMIIRDISTRRRMEDALRESEQKYSAIFNKAPFSASLARLPEGTFVEINEEFTHTFGYSRPEVMGKTPLELDMYPNPEDRERSASLMNAHGSVRNLEMKLQTRAGELRDFLVSMDMIGVDNSKYVITTAKDITERKQAEAALKRNEELLRLFVEHSPASIAMFDNEMRYIIASRRYLADYDLGEQDLIGRSHYDVFPEIPERWRKIHRRCLAGAIEKADEDPFPRASGKMDWVHWEIRPWYESNGEIGGVMLFSEVITERKLAEQEIRLSRDRLADLSRRLVEVHETERRALGRELHDQIGQMLTAMKITLDMSGQLPPEAARRKVSQAQELVNDLLNRISRLSIELRPPMLDDIGLVPALVWLVSRYQDQAGILVGFRHAGIEGKRFNPEVETTAYRAVQEALTNVARHARARHVRLEVQKKSGWMEIRIEDDGVGFDPETALSKNRGLGGMRERVQLVDGEFQIGSESNKGTRIQIRLPAKEQVQ